MKLSPSGLALLKRFEGFREHAYQDVAGVWTIGYGFTRGVRPGDRMSLEIADARLPRELRPYEEAVSTACTVPPTQPQFDAMVLLCYNIGPGWEGDVKPKGAKDGFRQSTVLRAHNRGDTEAASRAFGLWNKSGGKVERGLVRRRAQEAALYLTPAPGDAHQLDQSPPAVDPETRMAQSTINRAATAAGATAALGAVADTVSTVAGIKTSVDSLGPWLVPLLLVAVVGLCGYIVWQRIKQRSGGWA